MTHLKSNKISFSLKEQLKRLQSLCRTRVLTGIDLDNSMSNVEYSRIFTIEPNFIDMLPSVGLALNIEHDDRNNSGNIHLYMFRRTFVTHEDAIKMNYNHKTNQGGRLKNYILKSKSFTYEELKRVIADMNKMPSILSVIDVLNQKEIFDIDLHCFFCTDHAFKEFIMERNERLINEIAEKNEEFMKACVDNLSNNTELTKEEIEKIREFMYWDHENKEMIQNPIYLAKNQAYSLDLIRRDFDVKKIGIDWSKEKMFDKVKHSSVYGFSLS